MKSTIAAAFAALIATSAATAQELPLSNPTGTVPSVALEYVAPILREAGFSVQENFNGNANIMLADAFGRKIFFVENACQSATDCKGLRILAALSDSATAQRVNDFNLSYNATRAIAAPEGVLLDHYVIADFGISRGAIFVTAAVVASTINLWFESGASAGGNSIAFEAQAMTSHGASSLDDELLMVLDAARSGDGFNTSKIAN